MMNYFKNEKGVALVMVLVLSLISVAFCAALIFMVTQETMISGQHRFYRTADEASVGGGEAIADYISDRGEFTILGAAEIRCSCADPDDPEDNFEDTNGDGDFDVGEPRTCRCDKLCNLTADYDEGKNIGDDICDEAGTIADGIDISLNATSNPDLTFVLGTAPQDYNVSAKIVDTIQGNSDLGAIVAHGTLGGSAVSASGGVINPPNVPYMHRVEVEAQRVTNPNERSVVSVLYAF